MLSTETILSWLGEQYEYCWTKRHVDRIRPLKRKLTRGPCVRITGNHVPHRSTRVRTKGILPNPRHQGFLRDC